MSKTRQNNNKKKNINKHNKTKRNKSRGGHYKSKGGLTKCSPLSERDSVGDTCLTGEILNDIKKSFNAGNPDRKIKSANPKIILKMLKKHTDCNDENCWLNPLPDKGNILKSIFRPKLPEEWKTNKNEWLSNYDIMKVIKQYEQSNAEFEFIGPTFIDFASYDDTSTGQCVEKDLCNFDLNAYVEKGKTKIGIIFNLDKHDQSGSHWVSMFIDIEQKFIFYFNSTGEKIPKEITQLVNKISEQSKTKYGKGFKIHYNNLEHQKENTECGMYSLFFIISLVTGSIGGDNVHLLKNKADKVKFFTKKRIPDNDMENLRIKYFVNK
jgi:hypothetical protein